MTTSPDVPPDDDRTAELAKSLADVRARISAAAMSAGRDPGGVRLVVVTKYFPAADVRRLARLGVRLVGENRHQEAAAKRAECADLDVEWHFIGQLQSNKAAAVAGYTDVVESVDRAKLVNGLQRGAHERSQPIGVCLQVDLDDAAASGRGGATAGDLARLADDVDAAPMLQLRGVMAVAPLGVPPRPAFERLAEIAAVLRADHPSATWMSAGMSADFEHAIACGATHVRLGSAVLGPRPPAG